LDKVRKENGKEVFNDWVEVAGFAVITVMAASMLLTGKIAL